MEPTSVRSYAENAAAVLYAIDRPAQLDRALGLGDARPIKVGVITNYAEQGSKRFGSFRGMYGDLSEFSHPMSRSIFASTVPTDDGCREIVNVPSGQLGGAQQVGLGLDRRSPS